MTLTKIEITEEIKALANLFISKYMPFEKIKDYTSQWAIMNKNPNYTGLLGEIAINLLNGTSIQEVLEKRAKYGADKGFDIMLKGITYDIKTLVSKIPPCDYFRYNVEAKHLKKLQNHGYIFNCLLADESMIIPVGFVSRREFLDKAIFQKKGTKIEFNGFIFPCDAYNISIKDLNNIELLFNKNTKYTLDDWM